MRPSSGLRLVFGLCAGLLAFGAQAEYMAPSVSSIPQTNAPPVVAEESDNLEAAVPADTGAVTTRSTGKANAKGRASRQAAQPPRTSSHPFYVEFRSRHALSYGHTFMAYGRLTPDGKIATQTITGLHPKGDDATWWTIGHLVWVPSEIGPSDGDLEEEYISARYRIDLTPEQYNRVVAFAKKLGKESPMWHAMLYNCNAFVGRIAGFMGLKSPASLEYPVDFVNGMRTMNNGVNRVTTLKEPDVAYQTGP